ncbi:hypothetical protein HHI36_008686 [Cryptolaemus montrouzieri]|uniref:Uncharacterized protein n=1 Tax=Cryptolaemus montrouzieri TaxID=559131 RepID=A0ABD2MTQ2_9CUCU
MYDRLFTKLTDIMKQKIENLENKNIEKAKTATGSRSQGMEIVQQTKEKTYEEKSEYRRLVSKQQKLANALIHLESDVGKTQVEALLETSKGLRSHQSILCKYRSLHQTKRRKRVKNL